MSSVHVLKALDGDLLAKKKLPEDVASEAMNIIRDCQTGSGGDLMSRVRTLQNQFDKLSETCYESRELCEEATAAMQVQYTYGNMQWGRPENRGYYLHLPTNWAIAMSIFISIRLIHVH